MTTAPTDSDSRAAHCRRVHRLCTCEQAESVAGVTLLDFSQVTEAEADLEDPWLVTPAEFGQGVYLFKMPGE